MTQFFYGVFFTLGIQVLGVFILYKIMECLIRYRIGFFGEMVFKEGKKFFTDLLKEKEDDKSEKGKKE